MDKKLFYALLFMGLLAFAMADGDDDDDDDDDDAEGDYEHHDGGHGHGSTAHGSHGSHGAHGSHGGGAAHTIMKHLMKHATGGSSHGSGHSAGGHGHRGKRSLFGSVKHLAENQVASKVNDVKTAGSIANQVAHGKPVPVGQIAALAVDVSPMGTVAKMAAGAALKSSNQENDSSSGSKSGHGDSHSHSSSGSSKSSSHKHRGKRSLLGSVKHLAENQVASKVNDVKTAGSIANQVAHGKPVPVGQIAELAVDVSPMGTVAKMAAGAALKSSNKGNDSSSSDSKSGHGSSGKSSSSHSHSSSSSSSSHGHKHRGKRSLFGSVKHMAESQISSGNIDMAQAQSLAKSLPIGQIAKMAAGSGKKATKSHGHH